MSPARAHSEKWEPVFGQNALQNRILDNVYRLGFWESWSSPTPVANVVVFGRA